MPIFIRLLLTLMIAILFCSTRTTAAPALVAQETASKPGEAKQQVSTSRSGLFRFFGAKPIELALQKKLAALQSTGKIRFQNDTIARNKELATFYSAREDKPAWFKRGNPVPGAWQLLDAVRKSPLEGLAASDYHVRSIDSLIRRYNRKVFWHRRWEPETAAELDLLLTDAYLKLAKHLLVGRVKPRMPQDAWH
ncbi:MAG: hypothetical protein M3Y08_04805, partial [Fibrobacterota bacterium]|nr:hypothetical protein [Fibrobacterota bacterium]